MRILVLIVGVVALGLAGANANAQTETAAPSRADKSVANNSRAPVVKGRAVFEDTGQPASRYRVQLVGIEMLSNPRGPTGIPTTTTDANGDFLFRQAGPGEYYVVARPIDAHVPSTETSPFPLQTGDAAADAARLEQYKKDFTRITVSGEGPVEITLRVKNPHFGSISGRITDANGATVAGANVHAMRTGERGFGASQTADENGAYRFRGLTEGEYLVSADPPRKPVAEGSQSVAGLLGSTYFPSNIDSHNSPPVVVVPDGDVSDINIILAERSLHTVTGIVRAEGDGHPVAGATLRLNKKDADRASGNVAGAGIEAAMSNYFATTDAQGRWTLSNLPDGSYTIDVRPTGLVGSKLERFVNKVQDLTIAGSDVENLAIEVSLGGRVSGQVTVESTKVPPHDITIGIGGAFAPVGANGEFTMTGVPEGEFPLSVMIRPQNTFYAKSIQGNGADLLREKLKTPADVEIKDVRIVVAPASILTGRVVSASSRAPLSHVSVMLIPVDPSTAPAFVRPNGSTNDQGSFLVSGAPGEYFVILWNQGEPLPPRDADLIKKLYPNTPRVTLAPGERKSMDLVK